MSRCPQQGWIDVQFFSRVLSADRPAGRGAGSSVASGLAEASRGMAEGMDSFASIMQETGSGLVDKFRGFMSFQQVCMGG